MKQTVIPAGYRLSITSWENDADAYGTEVLEGLTKERVEFLLELCNLFKSGSNTSGKTFGNLYEPNSTQQAKAEAAITAVMEKHKPVLTEYELEQLTVVADPADPYSGPEYSEFVGDLLGYSENYTYRVYNGAKVEYIPHEITMEDVTSQFKV